MHVGVFMEQQLCFLWLMRGTVFKIRAYLWRICVFYVQFVFGLDNLCVTETVDQQA